MRRRSASLEDRLKRLLAFDLRIAAETKSDRLLPLLAEETRQLLDADRCAVFLYDRRTEGFWSILAHGLGSRVLRLRKDQGLVGRVFKTRKTLNIADAYADRHFSRHFDRLTGYRTRSVLAMPMLDSRHEKVLGVFQVLNKRAGRFDRTDEDLLTVLADHAAVAVENAQLYEELRKAQEETVFRLALMAEHRDLHDTAAHLRRVAVYCGLIAEALGWPPGRVERLRLVAPLHDIGKVATPDAILLKTGKLTALELGVVEYRMAWWMETLKLQGAPRKRVTEVAGYLQDIRQANRPSSTRMPDALARRICRIASRTFADWDGKTKPCLTAAEVRKLTIPRGNLTQEERAEIQNHTVYGAKILAQAESELLRLAERIAMCHHERYDGTGYPRRLKGRAIPIEGRVVALADVFDALSSKRVYKSRWSLQKVVAFIRQESGKYFDPEVVRAFLRALPRIRRAMAESGRKTV